MGPGGFVVCGYVGPGRCVCRWAAARPRDRHTRACGSERSISRPALALPPPTGTAAWPRRPRGGLLSVGAYRCERSGPASAHRHRGQADWCSSYSMGVLRHAKPSAGVSSACRRLGWRHSPARWRRGLGLERCCCESADPLDAKHPQTTVLAEWVCTLADSLSGVACWSHAKPLAGMRTRYVARNSPATT